MSLQRINDIVVKPLKQRGGQKKWKGHLLFDKPFINIYANGGTGSGKTTVIRTILEHVLEPKTQVYIICATLEMDTGWEQITQMLSKRKAPSFGSTSMENFPAMVERIARTVSKDPDHTKSTALKFVVILDDIGSDMRSKEVYQWLKSSRHLHCMTILSGQGTKNIDNNSRLQIGCWLLFPKLTPGNLREIYESTSPPVTESEFLKMYRTATREPYNFFYFTRSGDFRKNFNRRFSISE